MPCSCVFYFFYFVFPDPKFMFFCFRMTLMLWIFFNHFLTALPLSFSFILPFKSALFLLSFIQSLWFWPHRGYGFPF
jgi:hypothetical protein